MIRSRKEKRGEERRAERGNNYLFPLCKCAKK